MDEQEQEERKQKQAQLLTLLVNLTDEEFDKAFDAIIKEIKLDQLYMESQANNHETSRRERIQRNKELRPYLDDATYKKLMEMASDIEE